MCEGFALTLTGLHLCARKGHAGVTILSEFSESSRQLRGLLTINPWNQEQYVRILRGGVIMSKVEREHRWRKGACCYIFQSIFSLYSSV